MPSKKEYQSLNRYLALIGRIGLTMVASILLLFGLGVMASRMIGGNALFIVIMTLIGIGIGFFLMYLQLAYFFKDIIDENHKNHSVH